MNEPSQPRLIFVFLIALFWAWIAFGLLGSLTELLSVYLGGTFTGSSLISFLLNIPFIFLFSFFYSESLGGNLLIIGFQAFSVMILLPAIVATVLGFLAFKYSKLIPFLLFVFPLLIFLEASLKYFDLSFSLPFDNVLLLIFVPTVTFAWIAKRNKPERI